MQIVETNKRLFEANGFNGIQVLPPEIILNALELKNIEISLFFIQG